jgi:hypothetical protein
MHGPDATAADTGRIARPGAASDGRWLAVALLLIYYVILGATGPAAEMSGRWRRAGVYAHPTSFVDLQVFPAARATVAAGGELYGPSATDPLKRPYNYPRVWLTFMRFPAGDDWLCAIGCTLALAAVVAVVAVWGRLSLGEGFVGGLLLCSPAFQLGIERGNTDLAMLVLVAAGVWLAADDRHRRTVAALWWTAAVLKLYPVVALAAWFGGSGRAWLRRVWLPLGLFAVYLALTWPDLRPVLRNTGGGWVQSYGSAVLVGAMEQVQSFYGVNGMGDFPWAGLSRWLAVAGTGWMLVRGWGRAPGRPSAAPATAAARRALLGFRVGALVYVATFLAGSSFDYRQCFLLLALPQLFAWRREGDRLAAVVLVALLLSLGVNYLLAGWPGIFLNETAGWLLLFALSSLLAGTWRRAASAQS